MQVPGVAIGEPMMITCSACNGLNLAGTLFCGMCGKNLVGTNNNAVKSNAGLAMANNDAELQLEQMK